MFLNFNAQFLGCPIDFFSCGDDKCVSISQRCDGTKQCPNGKDELNCNILMEYMDPIDVWTRYLYIY